MLKRAIFGVALLTAGTGAVFAAVPDQNAHAGNPSLNRASPMIYDPAINIIHGKRPVGTTIVPNDAEQAALPQDDKQKPALHRASPMINDPLIGTPIHGAPPASASPRK